MIDWTEDTREIWEDELDHEMVGASFFQREDPFVRHIVPRKRTILEDAGLLTKVGVDVHPDPGLAKEIHWFNALLAGKGLRTSENFHQPISRRAISARLAEAHLLQYRRRTQYRPDAAGGPHRT